MTVGELIEPSPTLDPTLPVMAEVVASGEMIPVVSEFSEDLPPFDLDMSRPWVAYTFGVRTTNTP